MVRLLFLAHRYLGIAVGLIMLIWTVSGIIMMYQEYPELSDQEQRSLLSPLTFDTCCIIPAKPTFAEDGFESATIKMIGGEPKLSLMQANGQRLQYDLGTGEQQGPLTQQDADRIAADFASRKFPEQSFEFDQRISNDQWTVYGSYNRHRPLYRYHVADSDASQFYVSSVTGEVVQLTTRNERVWGYLGAVLHWLYPTILRQHTFVWAQTVIWLTIIGIFLTATGLYLGIRQYGRRRNGRHSPYRGLPMWHHYSGLFFGVLTLTWVFSGLFSMNPWGALEGEDIVAETERLTERHLQWEDITTALATLQSSHADAAVVRYEVSALTGEMQIIAYEMNGFGQRVDPVSLTPASLNSIQLRGLAERLLPTASFFDAQLIESSDTYYYDHHESREFPIFRVEVDDDESRIYYLSPIDGSIVHKVDRDIRWYRWLFYGLHRGDFTSLLRSRPLWDLFMVTFLLGVTAVCGTGTVMAWRRIKRDLEMSKSRSARKGDGKSVASVRVEARSSSLMVLVFFLVGCSETEEVEWIDVPLEDNTFFEPRAEYREGEYEILVLHNAALEYKLGMLEGDSISYQWTVEMTQPERLGVEFHGHTERVDDEPGDVMFYKVHQNGEEQGTLVAPFDGIHGWYFDNQTNEDITIKLNVAGFYEELEQ